MQGPGKKAKKLINHLEIENIGPIKKACVDFGDLTVLVGPQATGKSIFLQILKLVQDKRAVHKEMSRFNLSWNNSKDFFTLYFGDGMDALWRSNSTLKIDSKPGALDKFAARARGQQPCTEETDCVFMVPAQRVMSMREGRTRPFSDFQAGDPFSLREFSEKVHALLQTEVGTGNGKIFPRTNLLKESFKKAIAENIFGNFVLATETARLQKQVVLASGKTKLPYLVWSAGQREFVPLLLGLYWLMPPGKVSMREQVRWVIIEEPEMGLHPNAISVFMAMVLELLSRGYRVVLSTHSTHILDVVWGMHHLHKFAGKPGDLLEMLGMPKTDVELKKVASTALKKKLRVFYFERNGQTRDISGLDAASENTSEAGWGGLTEFTGRVNDVVSRVANQFESANRSDD